MSSAQSLRIAVAQIESARGDLDANVDTHLAWIERARHERADVLMFPEVSLTGHSAGPETLRIARRRDDPLITRLAEAAGPMLTVFGLIEEGPGAQFYNTAMAVADGELRFLHRKINLPTYGQLDEGKHYAGGRYVETFHVREQWRAGLLVCADLWNPALVWLAALHGATLLLTPISSAVEAVGAEFDNPGGWDINLRFYAMTYGLPLVMANRVGREGGLTFWGGSRILGPFGEELARAGDDEQLLLAEIDYERVRKARYLLPTVRDSNLALVRRETERLIEVLGVPEIVRKA